MKPDPLEPREAPGDGWFGWFVLVLVISALLLTVIVGVLR